MAWNSGLPQLVELPEEPYESKLYNCMRHYVIPGDTPGGHKVRVKALKVPGVFPYRRCLAQLPALLGTKWFLAQTHPLIAKANFCKAIECGLPEVYPLPMVLVMQEYENGNVLEYTRTIGASNLQRTKWLIHVGTALRFLHGTGFIHGNLHVNNIFIDNDNKAILADVMVYTTIIQHFTPPDVLPRIRFPDSLPCKSARSILEEELRPTNPTEHDDIFAFAVTIWTVYNGEEPFPMYEQTCQTIQRIASYAHRELARVAGISEGLWKLLSIIMSQETPPSDWPSLGDIISELLKSADEFRRLFR